MGKRSEELLTSNLMRGNSTLMVLAILKEGPLAGFAIAVEIGLRSQSLIDFKQGTLYPLLHEMERKELITSEWFLPAKGRPHRIYRPTDQGLAELDRGLEAWKNFATAMTLVTGVGPNGNPG